MSDPHTFIVENNESFLQKLMEEASDQTCVSGSSISVCVHVRCNGVLERVQLSDTVALHLLVAQSGTIHLDYAHPSAAVHPLVVLAIEQHNQRYPDS